MPDRLSEFKKYQAYIGDRTGLYKTIASHFKVVSALYPGSHIDVMPSFVIPDVTYIDNFKGTVKFFKEMEAVQLMVEKNKQYKQNCQIRFVDGDYREALDIEQVDLLISQFAGFVGQETKKYLKEGGILLCNDSHGDATLAFLDEDFELIGVVNSKNRIETKNLDQYFEFARKRPIDGGKVKKSMKGPNYKVKADNYIFRKSGPKALHV